MNTLGTETLGTGGSTAAQSSSSDYGIGGGAFGIGGGVIGGGTTTTAAEEPGGGTVVEASATGIISTTASAQSSITASAAATGNVVSTGSGSANAVLNISATGNTSFSASGNAEAVYEAYIKYRSWIQVEHGSQEHPSITFLEDTNTGLFRMEDGKIGVVSNGELVASIDSDGNMELEASNGTVGLVLSSPDGTRYKITVDNAGSLVTTAV